eukprot:7743385-Pyramimonas_sp.AAC.1
MPARWILRGQFRNAFEAKRQHRVRLGATAAVEAFTEFRAAEGPLGQTTPDTPEGHSYWI